MIRELAALSLLLAACPAAAIERRMTVYPHSLAKFERHVRTAINKAKLRLTVLEESVQPDYRMFLDSKFNNVQAGIIYRKATGRTENAVLELWDVRGQRGLVRYEFKLTSDEMEQRRAAQQFVEIIRNQMNLKDQPPGGAFAGDSELGSEVVR
jgi:hypothetical protein